MRSSRVASTFSKIESTALCRVAAIVIGYGGFFSYVRTDDETDDGYLTRLRVQLAKEVHAQTGFPFEVFQDTGGVLTGQQWRERIEQSVDSTTLLIAVLTPSFFQSEACRGEVERFLQREEQLGRNDLIVPIYYVTCDEIEQETDDEVGNILRQRQYFDWRDLRYRPLSEPHVRRRLHDLAEDMAAVLQSPIVTAEPEDGEADGYPKEDEPGTLELFAAAMDAFPSLNATTLDLAAEIKLVGELTKEATADLERAGSAAKPAQARLASVQRFAQRLQDPAERIENLSTQYVDQGSRVDAGMQELADRAAEVESDEDIQKAEKLLEVLGRLTENGRGAMEGAQRFIDAMKGSLSYSSSIRPPLRRMISSVELVVDFFPTIEDWESRLAAAVDQARSRSSS